MIDVYNTCRHCSFKLFPLYNCSKDEHCVIVDDDNGWCSDMDDFEFPLANIGSEQKVRILCRCDLWAECMCCKPF